MTNESSEYTRHFPLTTAIFEGGLVPLSLFLGWLLSTPPLKTFYFDINHTLLGILATLPLFVLLWFCLKSQLPPIKRIMQIFDENLVPLFQSCTFIQLAIIALLAGMGEEMLFRGVVQAAVAEEIGGEHGAGFGLFISAALFGLLHPITPTYALFAGLIGLYFGWLWLACGNLLVPMVAHGLYDFLALGYLIKFRKSKPSVE